MRWPCRRRALQDAALQRHDEAVAAAAVHLLHLLHAGADGGSGHLPPPMPRATVGRLTEGSIWRAQRRGGAAPPQSRTLGGWRGAAGGACVQRLPCPRRRSRGERSIPSLATSAARLPMRAFVGLALHPARPRGTMQSRWRMRFVEPSHAQRQEWSQRVPSGGPPPAARSDRFPSRLALELAGHALAGSADHRSSPAPCPTA